MTLNLLLKDPNQRIIELSAFIIGDLRLITPRFKGEAHHWTHLRDLEFTDPAFLNLREIDVLLGTEVYARLLREGLYRGTPGDPIAQ